jgi:uncharacterized protein (DUF1778 family)
MTAANQQIVTAYEVNGMTPEQIAETEGYDVTSVKSILMQFSSVYRRAMKEGTEDGFTEDEELRARQVIAQLAQYAEDDHLRFRASRYIRDDKKGRLDVAKKTRGLNINVLMINAEIQKATQAIENAKNRTIDLSPEQVRILKSADAKIV